MLGFFKNINGVLMIRHVFLEINLFEVDGAVRSLETLAELRHVKHVVHICKVGWKLKLIGEIASFSNDLERTHVSRGKLPFDTEATSAFHSRDAVVELSRQMSSCKDLVVEPSQLGSLKGLNGTRNTRVILVWPLTVKVKAYDPVLSGIAYVSITRERIRLT